MKRFDGKVAVVTGGASGIGLATASRLASEGAALALVDRDGGAVRRAAQDLQRSGSRVLALEADVSNARALAAVFGDAAGELGRLDVVINSAGIIARGNLSETSEDEWRRVLEVDLHSMFYSARAAVPLLRAAGGGAIVNVASVAGSRGSVNVAYAAAKGGVISLTRQLAGELAGDRIRVNSVSPGFTFTGLNRELRGSSAEDRWARRIPLARYADAREIAAACAFLASNDASYVTGTDLVVDGGLSAVVFANPFETVYPMTATENGGAA